MAFVWRLLLLAACLALDHTGENKLGGTLEIPHILRSFECDRLGLSGAEFCQPDSYFELRGGSCQNSDRARTPYCRRPGLELSACAALCDQAASCIGFQMHPEYCLINVLREAAPAGFEECFYQENAFDMAPDAEDSPEDGVTCYIRSRAPYFEVPAHHDAARCLQQTTVENFGIKIREASEQFLDMMLNCQRRKLRFYRVLVLSGLTKDLEKQGYVVTPDDVTHWASVCAPQACGLSTVGYWLTHPMLALLRNQEVDIRGRDSWTPLNSSTQGQVRLPPRRAYMAHLTLKQLTEWTKQRLFVVMGEKGDAWTSDRILVAEQKLPSGTRPAALPEPLSGVALIIAGQWRFRVGNVKRLRRHVLLPLQAEVFGVFSRADPSYPSWSNITPSTMRRILSEVLWCELADFAVLRDPFRGVLRAELASSDSLDFQQVFGGWLLGSLVGKAGTSLYAMRKLEAALAMVERREAQRGMQFEWLINTRLDLVWMANHPPLQRMSQEHVWMMDFGTDWYAAVPRAFGDAYFRRINLLRDGTAPGILTQGPSFFVIIALIVQGISPAVFSSVATLDACHWGCFGETSKNRQRFRWFPEAMRIARIAAGLRSGRIQWVSGRGRHLSTRLSHYGLLKAPALAVAMVSPANASGTISITLVQADGRKYMASLLSDYVPTVYVDAEAAHCERMGHAGHNSTQFLCVVDSAARESPISLEKK